MIATLTIRRLRADDIIALAGVLTRAYESQQHFDRRLRGYLHQLGVATFVADLQGEPVGMVVGNDYADVAYVSQMAVDPAVQGRGIGTALMNGLTAWADDRGFRAVELAATPAGAPLYARYGFAVAGRTVVYVADGGASDRSAARRYAASRIARASRGAHCRGSRISHRCGARVVGRGPSDESAIRKPRCPRSRLSARVSVSALAGAHGSRHAPARRSPDALRAHQPRPRLVSLFARLVVPRSRSYGVARECDERTRRHPCRSPFRTKILRGFLRGTTDSGRKRLRMTSPTMQRTQRRPCSPGTSKQLPENPHVASRPYDSHCWNWSYRDGVRSSCSATRLPGVE